MKTAEGAVDYSAPQVRDTPEPFVSSVRAALSGRTRELERLAVELYARGLSTRDIEDTFTGYFRRWRLDRGSSATHHRSGGIQPAHQSMINRRFDDRASCPAQWRPF
jgi:hypothetical protein